MAKQAYDYLIGFKADKGDLDTLEADLRKALSGVRKDKIPVTIDINDKGIKDTVKHILGDDIKLSEQTVKDFGNLVDAVTRLAGLGKTLNKSFGELSTKKVKTEVDNLAGSLDKLGASKGTKAVTEEMRTLMGEIAKAQRAADEIQRLAKSGTAGNTKQYEAAISNQLKRMQENAAKLVPQLDASKIPALQNFGKSLTAHIEEVGKSGSLMSAQFLKGPYAEIQAALNATSAKAAANSAKTKGAQQDANKAFKSTVTSAEDLLGVLGKVQAKLIEIDDEFLRKGRDAQTGFGQATSAVNELTSSLSQARREAGLTIDAAAKAATVTAKRGRKKKVEEEPAPQEKATTQKPYIYGAGKEGGAAPELIAGKPGVYVAYRGEGSGKPVRTPVLAKNSLLAGTYFSMTAAGASPYVENKGMVGMYTIDAKNPFNLSNPKHQKLLVDHLQEQLLKEAERTGKQVSPEELGKWRDGMVSRYSSANGSNLDQNIGDFLRKQGFDAVFAKENMLLRKTPGTGKMDVEHTQTPVSTIISLDPKNVRLVGAVTPLQNFADGKITPNMAAHYPEYTDKAAAFPKVPVITDANLNELAYSNNAKLRKKARKYLIDQYQAVEESSITDLEKQAATLGRSLKADQRDLAKGKYSRRQQARLTDDFVADTTRFEGMNAQIDAFWKNPSSVNGYINRLKGDRLGKLGELVDVRKRMQGADAKTVESLQKREDRLRKNIEAINNEIVRAEDKLYGSRISADRLKTAIAVAAGGGGKPPVPPLPTAAGGPAGEPEKDYATLQAELLASQTGQRGWAVQQTRNPMETPEGVQYTEATKYYRGLLSRARARFSGMFPDTKTVSVGGKSVTEFNLQNAQTNKMFQDIERNLRAIDNIEMKMEKAGLSGILNDFQKAQARANGYLEKVTQTVSIVKKLETEMLRHPAGSSARAEMEAVHAEMKQQLEGLKQEQVTAEAEYNRVKGLQTTRRKYWLERKALEYAGYFMVSRAMFTAGQVASEGFQNAVNIEQLRTIQNMYAGGKGLTTTGNAKADKDAEKISAAWGQDMEKIVEVQGLWLKQTDKTATEQERLATSMHMTNMAAQVARVSNTEMADSYDALLAVMTQTGLKVPEVQGVLDDITGIALKAGGDIQTTGEKFGMAGKDMAGFSNMIKDLLQALGEGSATMHSLGIRTKDYISIIALLKQSKPEESGVNLAKKLDIILSTLYTPKNLEALKANGIYLQKNAGDIERLAEAAQKLKGGALDIESMVGIRPDTRALFMALMNPALEKQRKALASGDYTGSLQSTASELMGTSKGQLDKFRIITQQIMIELSTGLLPVLMRTVQYLNTTVLPILRGAAGPLGNIVIWVAKAVLWFEAWRFSAIGLSKAQAWLALQFTATTDGILRKVNATQTDTIATEQNTLAQGKNTAANELNSRSMIANIKLLKDSSGGFLTVAKSIGSMTLSLLMSGLQLAAFTAGLTMIQNGLQKISEFNTDKPKFATDVMGTYLGGLDMKGDPDHRRDMLQSFLNDKAGFLGNGPAGIYAGLKGYDSKKLMADFYKAIDKAYATNPAQAEKSKGIIYDALYGPAATSDAEAEKRKQAALKVIEDIKNSMPESEAAEAAKQAMADITTQMKGMGEGTNDLFSDLKNAADTALSALREQLTNITEENLVYQRTLLSTERDVNMLALAEDKLNNIYSGRVKTLYEMNQRAELARLQMKLTMEQASEEANQAKHLQGQLAKLYKLNVPSMIQTEVANTRAEFEAQKRAEQAASAGTALASSKPVTEAEGPHGPGYISAILTAYRSGKWKPDLTELNRLRQANDNTPITEDTAIKNYIELESRGLLRLNDQKKIEFAPKVSGSGLGVLDILRTVGMRSSGEDGVATGSWNAWLKTHPDAVGSFGVPRMSMYQQTASAVMAGDVMGFPMFGAIPYSVRQHSTAQAPKVQQEIQQGTQEGFRAATPESGSMAAWGKRYFKDQCGRYVRDFYAAQGINIPGTLRSTPTVPKDQWKPGDFVYLRKGGKGTTQHYAEIEDTAGHLNELITPRGRRGVGQPYISHSRTLDQVYGRIVSVHRPGGAGSIIPSITAGENTLLNGNNAVLAVQNERNAIAKGERDKDAAINQTIQRIHRLWLSYTKHRDDNIKIMNTLAQNLIIGNRVPVAYLSDKVKYAEEVYTRAVHDTFEIPMQRLEGSIDIAKSSMEFMGANAVDTGKVLSALADEIPLLQEQIKRDLADYDRYNTQYRAASGLNDFLYNNKESFAKVAEAEANARVTPAQSEYIARQMLLGKIPAMQDITVGTGDFAHTEKSLVKNAKGEIVFNPLAGGGIAPDQKTLDDMFKNIFKGSLPTFQSIFTPEGTTNVADLMKQSGSDATKAFNEYVGHQKQVTGITKQQLDAAYEPVRQQQEASQQAIELAMAQLDDQERTAKQLAELLHIDYNGSGSQQAYALKRKALLEQSLANATVNLSWWQNYATSKGWNDASMPPEVRTKINGFKTQVAQLKADVFGAALDSLAESNLENEIKNMMVSYNIQYSTTAFRREPARFLAELQEQFIEQAIGQVTNYLQEQGRTLAELNSKPELDAYGLANKQFFEAGIDIAQGRLNYLTAMQENFRKASEITGVMQENFNGFITGRVHIEDALKNVGTRMFETRMFDIGQTLMGDSFKKFTESVYLSPGEKMQYEEMVKSNKWLSLIAQYTKISTMPETTAEEKAARQKAMEVATQSYSDLTGAGGSLSTVSPKMGAIEQGLRKLFPNLFKGKNGQTFSNVADAGLELYGAYENARNPETDKTMAVFSSAATGFEVGSKFGGAGGLIGAAIGGITALIGIGKRQHETMEKIYDQMPKRKDLAWASPSYLPFSAYAGGRATTVVVKITGELSTSPTAITQTIQSDISSSVRRGITGRTIYAQI